jgi:hypothetical protein
MGLLYDYHVMLTLGFVKVTNETVEKPENKDFRVCNYLILHYIILQKLRKWTFSTVSMVMCNVLGNLPAPSLQKK